MSLSPEQLEMRRFRLGGSDAPALFGLDPYRTAAKLRKEKLAALRGEAGFEGNHHTERGDFLEDGVCRWAAHRMGWEPALVSCWGSLPHPNLKHVLATPDRIYQPELGEVLVMQCKCPSLNSIRHGWNEPPPKVVAQLQWEMGLMEAMGMVVRGGVVCALIGDDVKTWPVEFEADLGRDMHLRAEEWFRDLLLDWEKTK